MQTNIYKPHPFLNAAKTLVRILCHNYAVEGKENIADGMPVVFISNHLRILGPFVILMFFPFRYRPWVIYNMIRLNSCMEYLKKDFVENKLGIKKPFSGIVAFFTALFCVAVMRSSDAIPTYRDSCMAKQTFEQTKACILKGQNVFIFPEKANVPFSEYINDFYNGFAHLGKMVYRDTGMELCFNPVFIDEINRKIFILEPEKFDGSNSFKAEKERLVKAVRNKINSMAVSQRSNVDAYRQPLSVLK